MRDTERKVREGRREREQKKINIEIPRGGSGREIRSWKTSVFRSEIEKVRGERRSNFLQTRFPPPPPRPREKGVSLIAETVPPRSPPMRKNQGMEVPVIGIPLRRAIRAIRDAAWKQIRRGKGGRSGGTGGESQRERECELLSLFFILRPLCSLGQYRFIRRPFWTSLRHPLSFLSFFPFPVYAGHGPPASIRFRSRPSTRSVSFPSVIGSPPTFNQRVYKASSSLKSFLGRIVQFFDFHFLFFFWKHANFFVAFGEVEIFRAPRNWGNWVKNDFSTSRT